MIHLKNHKIHSQTSRLNFPDDWILDAFNDACYADYDAVLEAFCFDIERVMGHIVHPIDVGWWLDEAVCHDSICDLVLTCYRESAYVFSLMHDQLLKRLDALRCKSKEEYVQTLIAMGESPE